MSEGKSASGGGIVGAAGTVVELALKTAATLIAVAAPILGVWFASSLAVYLDGPLWLAITIGLLAFPVLPLAWEGFARWRRSRAETATEPFLTGWDRLILRTLAVNLVFLTVVMGAYPKDGFMAVSTRGDWFLGGSESGVAQSVRRGVFAVAEGLQFLYDAAADENQFAEVGGEAEKVADDESLEAGELEDQSQLADETPQPAPTPTPDGTDPTPKPDGEGQGTAKAETKAPPTPAPKPRPKKSPNAWPFAETPHPVVTSMPESAKQSVETVGKYIAANVTDPYQRVKALHDFTATWVSYHAEALFDRSKRLPQDAVSIFKNRRGVCEGYARLLKALGDVTGDRILYITGFTRSALLEADGIGHAWNAVEIAGKWFLMDPTWDSGFVTGKDFTPKYGTAYFLTPPHIFGLDHFPGDKRWQLRAEPLTQAEFLRQPQMSPRFYRLGMRLESPSRSQVTVEGTFVARIDNPKRHHVMASWVPEATATQNECVVSGAKVGSSPKIEIRCELPRAGKVKVILFGGEKRYGTYVSMGQFDVINAP